MMNNGTGNSYSGNTRKQLYISLLGMFLYITLLMLLGYVGSKVNEIEETIETGLAYKPPITITKGPGEDEPASTAEHARIVYIPVYSHIYAMGGTPVLLETTLSIRNTDPEHGIVVKSVAYYDTKGKIIENYLDGDLALGPLESSEVLVKKRDIRGGGGASFMVTWKSAGPVYKPVVQAVMVGGEGDLKISFRTDGHPLTSRIEP
jgi:hypothetical protein